MKKLIALLFVCCVCVCSVGTVAFAKDVTEIETDANTLENSLEIPPTETVEPEPNTPENIIPEVSNEEVPTSPTEPNENTVAPESNAPENIIPEVPNEDFFTSPTEPSENTVDFSTTIAPTIVNVTIPLNVDVYINPNEDDGFLYGAIEVQNHTKAPVVVSIKNFQTGSIPFQRCISPYELPSGLSWNNMSVTQTQQYFSLGIKPIFYNNKTWAEEHVRDYVYAKDNFVQTSLGVISGEQTAYLGLRSFYGKAFTEEKRFQFSATFVVELKQ